MVTITFPNRESAKKALGFLAGRFSGRALRSGEVIVPEPALEALGEEGFQFTVLGKATYEQLVLPVRTARTAERVKKKPNRERANRRSAHMMTIRFPDRETEAEGLGFLLGRFSGRAMRGRQHIVPEAALEALTKEKIPFTVVGKTTYEQEVAALRGAVASEVQ